MGGPAVSKRERVFASLRGERPDRIPVSFWGHNYARESSAADLADETVRLALKHDWDFVKVQSPYTCFAECWGAVWRPSREPTAYPIPVAAAVDDAAELDELASAAPDYGPLERQLQALRLIRRGLPDDRPVLMTVFSPLMALAYCFADTKEKRPRMLAALREDHRRADRVLRAQASLLGRFARDCVDAGADGVFFASNLASRDLTTVDDLRRFQRPYDLRVLGAIADAPFTMVHVCGLRTHFDEFADYPGASFSWALGDGNPDLADGAARTGRAVVGGISPKPALKTMLPEQVAAEARAAIARTGGRGLLLAPGCSIDADTPEENLAAAVAAARAAG